jgi:hypothetical protein
MSRRAAIFLAAIISIVSLGAWATTYQHVSQVGAYYTTTQRWDSATGGAAGGSVRPYYAADSLRIGDAVYLSADNTVNASSTAAAYNKLVGVVVGGTKLGSSSMVATDASDAGTLAAIATTSSTPQFVWVLSNGRAWMRNDAAAALLAGDEVIPSASSTARIKVRTAAIDTFYRVIGKVIVGGAASSTVPVAVSVR